MALPLKLKSRAGKAYVGRRSSSVSKQAGLWDVVRNVCENQEPENKTTMLAILMKIITTTGTQHRQHREMGMGAHVSSDRYKYAEVEHKYCKFIFNAQRHTCLYIKIHQ